MKVIMPCWIVNEDLIELTRNAIDSIRKTADVFLIIVDNASPMGGGMQREYADLYIRNNENLGYAKAVNQGLKLCEHGEPVAVVNNDIRISSGWVSEAVNVFKDQFVCSLHYRMIPYDQEFHPGEQTWVGGKERWCTSSFFVVRNLQLYDEGFLNSYDDWDYWKRFRSMGYKQAYTNKAEYQHNDSYTQQFVPNRGGNDTRNREYFKKKHGGYPEDMFANEFPEQMSIPWKPQP